jgi:hypothetical protein
LKKRQTGLHHIYDEIDSIADDSSNMSDCNSDYSDDIGIVFVPVFLLTPYSIPLGLGSIVINSEEETTSNEEDFGEILPSKRYETLYTTADNINTHRDFFTNTGRANAPTTDNTLATLPKILSSEIPALVAQAPATHKKEIRLLMREWEYPTWIITIREGFNLCFHGYGSKRELLNKFAEQYCTDYPLITVNGYHPALTIKDITKQIANACGLACFKLDHFKQHMKGGKMYLLIHNIDGANLRTEKCQALLAEIASIPNLYFICSVDHYYAALLWDQDISQLFQFCFVDATNFANYQVETSFETNSVLGSGVTQLSSEGLRRILDSMTQNARKAFKTLATWQCKTANAVEFKQGLSIKPFYEMCQRAFITSSDIQFRAQLSEYKDHKVMISHQDTNGLEYLRIPLPKTVLEQELENLK